MPRDGSGAYTLPAGNPVTTGTLIQSTWANPTMADVAVQLNNVLTRDGLLGPVLPFKLVDGAVATPGLAFNSEPGTGLYRPSASVLRWASVNADIAELNASAVGQTKWKLFPRVAGAGLGSGLLLSNSPNGAANSSGMDLSITDTQIVMTSPVVGTGLELPLKQVNPIDQDSQVAMAYGQCRLYATSSSQLTLLPFNGNKITIADKVYRIPAAGVVLNLSGTAGSTVYNVFVIQTAGVLSLEVNGTARVTDATTGMPIKSGDRTRTLVGKILTLGANVMNNSPSQRFVLSYWNRLKAYCQTISGSDVPSGSTSYVGIVGPIEFLCWGDESIDFHSSGAVGNTIAGAYNYSSISIDSTTAPVGGLNIYQPYVNAAIGPFSVNAIYAPAEGYHAVRLLGKVSSGVCTWYTNSEIGGLVPI